MAVRKLYGEIKLIKFVKGSDNAEEIKEMIIRKQRFSQKEEIKNALREYLAVDCEGFVTVIFDNL